VGTMTRKALASRVICTGLRPRISPSMSRSIGGSVSSHSSRVVRKGVRASGRRGPVTVWRRVAAARRSRLESPSR
jgi:hypothetical protein